MSDAIKEKHFVVIDSGTAITYKEWHDFTVKTDNNRDAHLTVRRFKLDRSLGKHVETARYELDFNDNMAV